MHASPLLAALPILSFGIEHEGKDYVVIGTLFKDMKLRPTILDEYIKVGCMDSLACYVSLVVA